MHLAPAFLAALVLAAIQAPGPIRQALADPRRPAADRAADPARKPAETLAFAGVAPGLTIVELLPGDGYFTRILSRAVGPEGVVITIPWREFQAGATRALAEDPHYGNIRVFDENLLGFRPAAPVDLIFTAQNYHDFATPQRAQINQILFRALKPGGVLVVLDHAGAAGSGYGSLSLHRIDEALVRREVEAAGFRFAGESDLLRNPADDRRANVFSPAIRGRTDQFLLKFRKPGG